MICFIFFFSFYYSAHEHNHHAFVLSFLIHFTFENVLPQFYPNCSKRPDSVLYPDCVIFQVMSFSICMILGARNPVKSWLSSVKGIDGLPHLKGGI